MMDTSPGRSSWTLLRVVAGVAALPTTGFALLMLFAQIGSGFDSFRLILGSTAATVAILCWYFVARGHRAESRSRLRYALWGGFVVGGVSFLVGFVGPIIVTPEANQGPLLGIFVTGPAGFVAGVILGALYAMFRV